MSVKHFSKVLKLKKFFSFLFLLFLPLIGTSSVNLQGIDYYVDTGVGNDSNSGSQSSPLKTISAAVSKAVAGDTIWINSGVYREIINLLRSGTDPSHPISLRAIPGANVQIKGSDLVTGWVNHSGSIWKRTNWTVNSQQVFSDGIPLQQIGKNCPYNNMSVLDGVFLPTVGMGFQDMFTGSFYYDPSGKILYIWLPDGSNPNGHNIEASVRDFIIPPTELQYIELHNLNFSHSNLSSKTAMLAVVNVFGKNWVVSDCSFTYGDLYGLAITGENHKIINNIANHNGNVGISINGSDAAHNWSIYPNRPPQNILLEGNQTSYNNYRKFDARWQAGGIKAAMFCNGITIYHHRAESNIGSGIWFDIACSNIRIEQCIVNNNLGGIAYEISDNAVIANNLVKQNMYQGIYVSASSGVYSLNNTVVQNGYGIVLHGMPRADHPTLENNTLRNNIISNSKWIDLVAFTGTGATGNSSDYNLYDGNLRISLTTNIDYKINYTNLSDFTRDTGQEVHSLNASPQFKNSTTGDYKLLTGSPAIDAGTNLVAGSISNKDLAGNTRIVDGRKTGEPIIDIGTYECSDALQLSAPKSLRVIE